MTERIAKSEILFAVGCKLWPQFRNFRVVRQLTTCDTAGGHHSSDALPHRERIHELVFLPCSGSLWVGVSGPQIYNTPTIDRDAHCRANFLVLCKVVAECITDDVERRVTRPVDSGCLRQSADFSKM